MIYDDIYSFKVGRVSESREKGKGGEERRERERSVRRARRKVKNTRAFQDSRHSSWKLVH